MKIRRFLSAMVLSSAIAGTAQASSNHQGIAEASNRFGAKSLHLLLKSQSQKNVIYSPLSAHLALSLLANGASGPTADQLIATLQLPKNDLLAANHDLKGLMQELTSRPKGELTLLLANGVWADPGVPILPSYIKTAKEVFGAEAAPLRSAQQINDWAAEHTNGLIKQVIDDIGGIEMILANATYFKADWTQPFGSARLQAFNGLGSKVSTAELMTKKETTKYTVSQGRYEAVEIPYGPQKLASMILIMPTVPSQFAAMQEQMDEVLMSKILQDLAAAEATRGEITMPKFEFKTSYTMNQDLQTLGMVDAFSGAADFSKMSEVGLKVSFVKQDAVIKVHEKGTEAAAVTTIGMEKTSIPRPPTFMFVADRPFIFAIRDNQSGVILFAGQVVQP
ncbi:MAG: serpin family protein [Bdellovibrionales bacterium]